jgi:ubiquinone/menaquinone biosynthesis C-methylase UbiE
MQSAGVAMLSGSATLPAYAPLLMSQHRAFERELRAIVYSLPVRPDDCVLDLACGDGAYSRWLAETGANVLAIDLSHAFLELAQREVRPAFTSDSVEFARADFRRLPFGVDRFDLVWCAQSLQSLSDPLEALQIMRRAAKPGGFVAALENDEFHHVLLPWPVEIELALAHADLVAHIERSKKPRKFYVGRQLLELFHLAGLTDCRQRSWTFDRRAPLAPNEREFFARYLHDLRERTKPHIAPAIAADFERLASPDSDSYLLDSPHFAATCLNYVIWGTKLGAEQ